MDVPFRTSPVARLSRERRGTVPVNSEVLAFRTLRPLRQRSPRRSRPQIRIIMLALRKSLRAEWERPARPLLPVRCQML